MRLFLFDSRQVAIGIENHNDCFALRSLVDPCIARSNRWFTAFLQHLIFIGAMSLATAYDVLSTARRVSESGFQHESRDKNQRDDQF